MNMFDLFIGIFVGIGAYYGWKKGLIMAAFQLIAIITGVYVAFHFSNEISLLFVSSNDGAVVPMLFFLLVLIGVYFLIKLSGRAFERSVRFVWPSVLNNLFGSIIGALKWCFMVGSVLLVFNSLDPSDKLISHQTKEGSFLYTFSVGFAENIMPGVKNTLILGYDTVVKS